MTRQCFFLCLLFCPPLLFAQNGFWEVKSAPSLESIPFASISNLSRNQSYTADSLGRFYPDNSIIDDTLFISSVGFHSNRFVAGNNKLFLLEPKISELTEVLVNPPKWGQSKAFGNLKKKKVNFYFGNNYGTHNWQNARQIEIPEGFEELQYLRSVSFMTTSQKSNVKFEVILYDVGEDVLPGNYLHSEKIIGHAKKGRQVSTVDLTPFNVKIPSKGLFVAVQWLLIEENVAESQMTDIEGNRLGIQKYFEPSFGAVPGGPEEVGYRKGGEKWEKVQATSSGNINYAGKSKVLALAFELSN